VADPYSLCGVTSGCSRSVTVFLFARPIIGLATRTAEMIAWPTRGARAQCTQLCSGGLALV